MRIALCWAAAMTLLAGGCRRPQETTVSGPDLVAEPAPEPTEPALNAPPPGTLVGDEADVQQVMEDYVASFVEEDAEACLALMTPRVQELTAEWYRSGEAFAMHGSQGQKTFEGVRQVEVLRAEGSEAEVAIHGESETPLDEWGPIEVLLELHDGQWLIAEPPVSPPSRKAG